MCVIALDTNAGYKCQNPAFYPGKHQTQQSSIQGKKSITVTLYQQNIPLVTFSPPLIRSKPLQTSDIKTCLNGTQKWVQTQYILPFCIWQMLISEVTYSFKVLKYTFNHFWCSLGYPQSWHYQPQRPSRYRPSFIFLYYTYTVLVKFD